MITLQALDRDTTKGIETIRKEGYVPAVFYGPKVSTTSVMVPESAFRKVWKEAGESSVVVLETSKGKINTLIHDVQFHAVKGTPLHVDFYAVEAGKEVSVHVPVEFEGVAPAVKELGGILVKVLHEIEVKAMPDKLPHSVTVDVSALVAFDSQITVSDIKLPSGVTAVTDTNEVVASIAQAVEEQEEAVPVDLSAIEVEKKGKKEEEEAAE